MSQLKSDLQGSREQLFASIHGLSEEQFRFVPAGGDGWSIAAHLAHLMRIERVFASRAQAALVEHEPRVPSTRVLNDDDPGASQKLAVPQIIHGMLNARRDLEGVLDACDDAGLERAINHERLGRMTIRQIAAKMAGHEAQHGEEIARLVRQVPATARVIIPLTRRS